jgi:hypothetical protein
MNHHLALKSPWYVELRRRQLSHVNLLTAEEWTQRLKQAGFTEIAFSPYLDAADCKLWDRLDSPFCVGANRYTLSAVIRILGKAVPQTAKNRLRAILVRHLCQRLSRTAGTGSEPCAAAFVARKPT